MPSFTRNPQSPYLTPFQLNSGEIIDVVTAPNFQQYINDHREPAQNDRVAAAGTFDRIVDLSLYRTTIKGGECISRLHEDGKKRPTTVLIPNALDDLLFAHLEIVDNINNGKNAVMWLNGLADALRAEGRLPKKKPNYFASLDSSPREDELSIRELELGPRICELLTMGQGVESIKDLRSKREKSIARDTTSSHLFSYKLNSLNKATVAHMAKKALKDFDRYFK